MMVLFSSWLLPGGQVSGEFASNDESDFLTELTVRRDSPVIGKRVKGRPFLRLASVQVTAIKRLSSYVRHDLEDHELRPGDRVVAQLDLAELISLRQSDDFKIGIIRTGDVGPLGEELVEATVAPSHPSIGSRLFDIPFLSQLNVRILGMTRYRNLPRSDLTNARIHAADRLLVTGSSEDIARMYENPNLFGVGPDQDPRLPPGPRAHCHRRAGGGGRAGGSRRLTTGRRRHIGRGCHFAGALY